jgi:Flp pilus assembly protein TadG
MQRLRPQGDDGAVAVFVGILLVVLFGMGALAIDVGAMYAERRQLQNGADAAALAVAVQCAKDVVTGTCASADVFAIADVYADGNANDGEANVDSVTPNLNTEEVAVSVSTLNDGSTALPPVFGRVLLGDAYSDVTVGASATAAWGFPNNTRVSHLGIAQCEFDRLTNAGFGALTPEEIERDASTSPECLAAGVESGFRWFNKKCSALETYAVDQKPSKVRSRAGRECTAMLELHRSSRQPVLISLYEPTGGGKKNLTITGFAAFVVTDYDLHEGDDDHEDDDEDDDDGDVSITGDFVFFTTDNGELGGPDNRLAIVRLID